MVWYVMCLGTLSLYQLAQADSKFILDFWTCLETAFAKFVTLLICICFCFCVLCVLVYVSVFLVCLFIRISLRFLFVHMELLATLLIIDVWLLGYGYAMGYVDAMQCNSGSIFPASNIPIK